MTRVETVPDAATVGWLEAYERDAADPHRSRARSTGCSSRARSTGRPISAPARRRCRSESARALADGDFVAGTYRGHGHALAMPTDPEALVAEMLGRASGVCGGRAGSMNVVDLEHGLVGCFGIVGGSIAAATGAAITARRNGGVAVAFFGDGATNQAYFHECLNFAQVQRLPVVFVCENNFYGEFTPMESVTAGTDIAGRGRAYSIASSMVDGNDVGRSTRRPARRSIAREPGTGRRCSSVRPTVTTVIRSPIRPAIGPMESWNVGSSAIRSTSLAAGCWISGSPRTTSRIRRRWFARAWTRPCRPRSTRRIPIRPHGAAASSPRDDARVPHRDSRCAGGGDRA